MIRLNANPQTVDTLLGALQGTPEELGLLASIVQTHGANPTEFYTNNPPPEASVADIQATPAARAGDWSRMVHPHVTAQLLVNFCERFSVPLPDNLHVAVDGAWQPLSYVPPTMITAAPSPAPAPAPAPAPSKFPEPERISVTQAPPVQQVALQPDPPAQQESVTREVMGAQITMPATAAQQIDAARDTPRGAEPASEISAADALAGFGAFGLPLPTMTVTKGTSPFDKDPGGKLPKGAAPRQLRDMDDMANRVFAMLAGDVVGKGTGAVQRQRYYTTLLALLDRALASVPDEACTVGYLRWHISHLRFNASQTAAGASMAQFEEWALAETKEAP